MEGWRGWVEFIGIHIYLGVIHSSIYLLEYPICRVGRHSLHIHPLSIFLPEEESVRSSVQLDVAINVFLIFLNDTCTIRFRGCFVQTTPCKA